MIAWLAFMPRYSAARGSQRAKLGAHGFRTDAPRSLCGYVERHRAGEPAGDSARRCVWCERVERGESPDRSNSGRGWSANHGQEAA